MRHSGQHLLCCLHINSEIPCYHLAEDCSCGFWISNSTGRAGLHMACMNPSKGLLSNTLSQGLPSRDKGSLKAAACQALTEVPCSCQLPCANLPSAHRSAWRLPAPLLSPAPWQTAHNTCLLPPPAAHGGPVRPCPSPHLSLLQAMNRSLANVILGGYSTTVTAQVKGEALQHQEVDVAGAVDALTNARSIIIVSHRIS